MSTENMVQARILEFGRILRDNGFLVGFAEQIDAQRTVLDSGIFKAGRLFYVLRSLYCSSYTEWQKFRDLFENYWYPAKKLQTNVGPGNKTSSLGLSQSEQVTPGMADMAERGEEGVSANNSGVSEGASTYENLAKADFRFITDKEQIYLVELYVARLARKMRQKVRCRYKLRKKAGLIDLRKTIRDNLHFGGIPLKLKVKAKKTYPPHLLLFVDVSRSMSMYSFIFLRFVHGIIKIFKNADGFQFIIILMGFNLYHLPKIISSTSFLACSKSALACCCSALAWLRISVMWLAISVCFSMGGTGILIFSKSEG